MKAIYIIFTSIMLFGCATFKHQHTSKINATYKALSTFESDTLKYIRYNFYENQQYYINKPLKLLFNDLETDILYFTPSSMVYPMDKSNGVSFSFSYTKYESDILTHTIISTSTAVVLNIELNEQYLYDDALKLWSNDAKTNWGKVQEDFYKEFTIKEIYIYIPETE